MSAQESYNFHGPWPTTCIGSVLASPQLLDSAASRSVGPLLFDREGHPQRLASVGGRNFESEWNQGDSLNHLLEDFLDADAAADLVGNSDGSHGFLGNQLWGVQGQDAITQLFFPTGDNQDRVGGALLSSSGKENRWRLWSSLGHSGASSEKFTTSVSLHSPILQLSGVKDDTQSGVSLIAARSLYCVSVLRAFQEEGHIRFTGIAGLDFNDPLCHVAWNPHIYGEAVVAFATGNVCMLDAEFASGNVHLTPTGTPISSKGNGIYGSGNRWFWQEQANRRERLKHLQRTLIPSSSVKADWWCCEYAWHPRTVFVAGSEHVSLVDFRSKAVNPRMQAPFGASEKIIHSRSSIVAKATCYGYCTQSVDRDHFLAFSRDDIQGMYHFCVASRKHLLLYDVRRSQTPVLQWEHTMSEEPPKLLVIHPMSSIASGMVNSSSSASSSGSIVLAASVRSGDIRAFCYGPQSAVAPVLPTSVSRAKKKTDLDDVLCAWELPSKVFAPQEKLDDFSSGIPRSLRDVNVVEKCISGLIVLSHSGEVRGNTIGFGCEHFSIVQLTGESDIVVQNYKGSDQLTAGTAEILPNVNTSLSAERAGIKIERMPALFNYIRKGFVWPAYHSSPSENDKSEQYASVPSTGQKRKRRSTPMGLKGRLIKIKQVVFDQARLQRCLSDIVGNIEARSVPADCGTGVQKGEMNNQLIRKVLEPDCPLAIHEVGSKLVQMQLPSGAAQLPSGMPSHMEDLSVVVKRRPSPLASLLGGMANEVGLLSSEGAPDLSERHPRVPLPLLIDFLQHRNDGYLSVVKKRKTDEEGGPKDGSVASSVKSTYEVLMEEYLGVSGSIDQVQLEQEMDSGTPLLEDTESENHKERSSMMTYNVLWDIHDRIISEADREALDQAGVPRGDGPLAPGPNLPEYYYTRFVAGRKRIKGSPPDKGGGAGLDPSICPIVLPYDGKDVELDAYSLEKLKARESAMCKWTQSLPQYQALISRSTR